MIGLIDCIVLGRNISRRRHRHTHAIVVHHHFTLC